MDHMSFEKRVQFAFILAVLLVLFIGLFSFFYLHRFNEEVRQVVEHDVLLTRNAERLKASLYETQRLERLLFSSSDFNENRAKLAALLKEIVQISQEGEEISIKSDNEAHYKNIVDFIDAYQKVFRALRDPSGFRATHANFWTMVQGVVGEINQVIHDRYAELEDHQKLVRRLQSDTQRNMIVVILLTFISGLGLTLVMPKIVTAPFKKIIGGLEEARQCNFDVKLAVEGHDEIAQVGRSVNRLLDQIAEFDNIKVKRIAFEQRKFDNLANMLGCGVILINREGYIEYLNSHLYTRMGVETEDVIGIEVAKAPFAEELKELFLETLTKLQKFDGQELMMTLKREKEGEKPEKKEKFVVDCNLIRNHLGDIVNLLFTIVKA